MVTVEGLPPRTACGLAAIDFNIGTSTIIVAVKVAEFAVAEIATDAGLKTGVVVTVKSASIAPAGIVMLADGTAATDGLLLDRSTT